MQVKPIGNRILVKTLSKEEVTASGIILAPNAEQSEKSQYEIVAVGNGEEVSKLGLSVGQVVVAGKYSGDEVEMGNERDVKYKILYVGKEKDENDVLAIVEK
jgi:chaperonin GroES